MHENGSVIVAVPSFPRAASNRTFHRFMQVTFKVVPFSQRSHQILMHSLNLFQGHRTGIVISLPIAGTCTEVTLTSKPRIPVSCSSSSDLRHTGISQALPPHQGAEDQPHEAALQAPSCHYSKLSLSADCFLKLLPMRAQFFSVGFFSCLTNNLLDQINKSLNQLSFSIKITDVTPGSILDQA